MKRKARFKRRAAVAVDGVLRKSTQRATDWQSLAGPIRETLREPRTLEERIGEASYHVERTAFGVSGRPPKETD